MNKFHKDSLIFFREASIRILNDIDDNELIQICFNIALGSERLLKGILYDINPTYIYIEPHFKHSMQVLYKHLLLPNSHNGELAANPNADVITFSNSILRAQLVSQTVADHKNVMFAISNARDLIAHCDLSLLDYSKLRDIVRRDFYTMIKSFANELGFKTTLYFGPSSHKLSKLSSTLQTDLNLKLELLFDTHREKWRTLKGNKGFVEDKDKVTKEILTFDYKESFQCPACENDAVIYFKPILELDNVKFEDVVIGTEVKKLKCQYCKLEVSDPSTLDHLGIKGQPSHALRTCTRCGNHISNSNSMCEECEEYYATDA